MWWIGALVGALLGFTTNGSAVLFALCGAVLGHALKINLFTEVDKLKKANEQLQDQMQAALKEFGNTLRQMEDKLRKVERELQLTRTRPSASQQSASAPAEQALAPLAAEVPTPSATATKDVHAEELVSQKAPITQVNIEPAPTVATTSITPPTQAPKETAEPPQQAVAQDTSTKANSAELRKEQAAAARAAIPTAKAIPNQSAVRASPPRLPSKSFRESLPAPLANFIFGGNLLVKVGVLILFLGLAFLLRYAAERVTVPIEMRYLGVTITGLVLLVLGWMLRHKRRDYGLSLQGMAIGVFYLSSLSALKVHSLISPEMGFGFLFVLSVLSAALAVLQNAPVLAIIAALEGFASPILTSTGANRPLGLFTYLAVLDIGIFLVAWFNAWRVLNLIAFVGTFTLSIGWADKFYADSDYSLAQPFLIFFFVLFAIIGVLFARRTLSEARHNAILQTESGNPLAGIKIVGRVDSALVFGNPITAFGLQYLLVKHTEFGAAFSALAIAFFYLVLARLIFSKEKQGLALLAEAYVIVATIFATLAIPLGLEGTWTSAAWAVEGAGMYWLGTRQQRPYARAFAYLVLVGATVKLLHSISFTPYQAVLLHGSLLGPVLLGCSALVMWRLHLRRSDDSIAAWEYAPGAFLPWLGIAACNILPWMLYTPTFAAAINAVFALLVSDQSLRRNLPSLRTIAATTQALSLISFLLSLHKNVDPNQAGFLEDGWRGMLAAAIIAISILLNAGRHMWRAKRDAEAEGLAPAWTHFNSIALVSAFGLLHLAMLFAIDLRLAAAIWPLTSCLVLWGALWMSHSVLATFAMGLQFLSAVLFLTHRNQTEQIAFLHPSFYAPIALAIAAWWSGDRIRAEAQRFLSSVRQATTNQNTSSYKAWLNPWCNQEGVLTLPVVWGLAWWMLAWLSESEFALMQVHHMNAMASVALVVGITTSVLMLGLAKWRNWQQMGRWSTVSLIVFMYSAALGIAQSQHIYLPSAQWGWLLWPLAMLWQWFALRRQEIYFNKQSRILALLHILGLWLMLFVASKELQGQLSQLSAPQSSWPLLGWVFAPAIALYFSGSRLFRTRWPIAAHPNTYAQVGFPPIALYLFIWTCVSNFVSPGNTQPLPYLPLINPLELAQVLIMLCLFGWWQQLPTDAAIRSNAKLYQRISAVTCLALLSGMVLRGVHHFGDVPWNADALFDSRLAQAAMSITWAVCGVGMMLLGNRRASRTVWMAGVALLAVVVLKLFVIELADRGGLYRIVSFIGVGIAFLVVGYFAPVPVKSGSKDGDKADDKIEEETQK